MAHLVRVIILYVMMGGIFGCATAGELRHLKEELAVLEGRLRSCDQAVEKAENVLKDAGQKALSIQRRLVCNNCVRPPNIAQCAVYCVIEERTLWDEARPHPTKSTCARLRKETMTLTLENAQDLYLCARDAYTDGVVEMQERD